MKRVVVLGISATLVAGILFNVSLLHYGQYVQQKRLEEDRIRMCGSGHCTGPVIFTSYFFGESMNFMLAGLAAGSFGVALLVIKRQELS